MVNFNFRLSASILTGASLLVLAACQTTQSDSDSSTTATATMTTAETTETTTQTTQAAETTEVAAVSETVEQPEKSNRQLDNVMFLDSTIFDDNLSTSLSDKTDAVKVDIPAKFSLNEIPDRMNVWLQRVQESGGTVNAQPIPDPNSQSRSIIGALISITIELISYARKEAMYKPADDYDVTLMYDEETGEVKEVVFMKR